MPIALDEHVPKSPLERAIAMILGYTLLNLALLATVIAAGLFIAGRGKNLERLVGPARWAALAAALSVIGASVYLDYLIATHQFQVAYVAEYSARRSSKWYLFAAFWGGQEGSILLWTFWTSILGAFLAWKARDKSAKVWPIFALVQTFLLVLVLVKCPFQVSPGPAPADGRGLNPLLENQWMVIHPPILFLGFASLAIPWVWSMYGLLYKDWDGWVQRVFPWALFSFAVHGFGVALGGYWAYETLGWGGFWGWDPVENSSLVPWLFLIALLHGLPIQRANGGYKVSNFLLAALPFGFMCYGTFLTRTGLLSDFSVHSFSSLGKDGFALLLGEVIAAVALPLLMVIARFRSIPKPPSYERVFTREFGFFIASILLGLIGFLTAVGMSAPLITKLWIAKGAAAQPEYYNKTMFPLAILMLISLAATPYFTWRATNMSNLGARLLPAYVGAVAVTVVFFLCGCRNPWMILLFAAGMFAVLTNIMLLPRRIRKRESRMTVGGIIAHMGVAIALIGIACLVAFSRQAQHVPLVKNRPVDALGYKLTYLGMTSDPYNRSNALRIKVEKDGKSWEATPHLYLAPWGDSDQLFANPPDIKNFAWGDLYIAHYRGPSSLFDSSPNNGLTMSKGDTKKFGEYTFTFKGLKWSDEVAQATEKAKLTGDMSAIQNMPQMRIHALMDITYQGKTHAVEPELIMDNATGGKYSVPIHLPNLPNAIITLSDIQLPFTGVVATANLPDPGEMVVLDISTKPLVWLVWVGTVLYTLGGIIAFRRRAREVTRPVTAPEESGEPDVILPKVPAGAPAHA
jgi:cytochrome c-type biogenesis protein CcmF